MADKGSMENVSPKVLSSSLSKMKFMQRNSSKNAQLSQNQAGNNSNQRAKNNPEVFFYKTSLDTEKMWIVHGNVIPMTNVPWDGIEKNNPMDKPVYTILLCIKIRTSQDGTEKYIPWQIWGSDDDQDEEMYYQRVSFGSFNPNIEAIMKERASQKMATKKRISKSQNIQNDSKKNKIDIDLLNKLI
ncbi:MAG: hypothetical protein MHPSP_000706 [Paramarteilia canceri]